MPLKAKLILLALIPVVLVSASISWISIYQAKTLGQREVEIFHQNLIQSKEAALKDTVDLAFDAISHIYNDPMLEEADAKARVKAILNRLRYGSDGYFFAYDKHGTNLVHPILPDLVGQNLLHIQDENGDHLIEALLYQAQLGAGSINICGKSPLRGRWYQS